MDCSQLDPNSEELLAHRFASALIIPAEIMRGELGAKRRHLAMREVAILKRKYGLSMQGLVRRARDLQIIDEAQYRSLCVEFSQFGWKGKEPVEFVGDEKPQRLLQMTLRAVTEGIISSERAEQVCPGCTVGVKAPEVGGRQAMSAADVRRLPREQRDVILATAAKCAEHEYVHHRALTDFEAFSEEDLNGADDAR
jgi:hypothetical protein